MQCHICGGAFVEMELHVGVGTEGNRAPICEADDEGVHESQCVTREAYCALGHTTTLRLLRYCNDQEPEKSFGVAVDDEGRPIGSVSASCAWVGDATCGACPPGTVTVFAWPQLPLRPELEDILRELLAKHGVGAKFVRALCKRLGHRYTATGAPAWWYENWPWLVEPINRITRELQP